MTSRWMAPFNFQNDPGREPARQDWLRRMRDALALTGPEPAPVDPDIERYERLVASGAVVDGWAVA